MSSQLKDIYSPAFYEQLATVLTATIPGFDQQVFIRRIFNEDFEQKELKARMRHTAAVVHSFLGPFFPDNAVLISAVIKELRRQQFGEDQLAFMFLPDYVEVYGLDHYEAAVTAIEELTQFVSCEYAVRPLLLRYEKQMIRQMIRWAKHDNHKVRRLASEGSRPRLPWAVAIPALKADPGPILPLLESLKNDPHEWVRKSVANCLNDIAKDHPELVIRIAKDWKGRTRETDAIVKHGCRTLLKQAHPAILELYGLDSAAIALGNFDIPIPEVTIGDYLSFNFTVSNKSREPRMIRLEYAVYYLRQNNSRSKKVFKISERIFEPGETITIQRRQSFKLITTRQFYPGIQQLSVIINGKEHELRSFELKNGPAE